MDRKFFVYGKIISIDQIIEVAQYLESKREYYTQLIIEDEKKNENIPYSERRYCYNGNIPRNIEYEIHYTDGRKDTLTDFQSFIYELQKPQYISKIGMYFSVHYSDNFDDINVKTYKSMNVFFDIYDSSLHNDNTINTVTVKLSGDNLDSEIRKIEDDIRIILEKNEDRISGVVKYRKLVKLCFCLSLGFIISYLFILIMFLAKDSFDSLLEVLFNDAFAFLLSQWFIALLFGASFGLLIINSLFKTLAPQKKYSRYDKNIHMAVYKDDVTDFKESNEVHIGKCADNKEKRIFLSQLFNVTKVIVLVQLVISMVLFVVMPK